MSSLQGWSKSEQAFAVKELLRPGCYVNLGIGMPSLVSTLIRAEDEIYLHCENGLTGYRDLEEGAEANRYIIDAASKPVSLIPGASIVAHDISFAIARGGRLDVTILGAYQVDRAGSFANWKTPDSPISGVGGAMDLAVGAKEVIIMMKHLGKNGEPKILKECNYPLTAYGVVNFVVTEYATLEIIDNEIHVLKVAPGISDEQLQKMTEVELNFTSETKREAV